MASNERQLQVHFDHLVADAHADIYELNHRLNEGESHPLLDVLVPRYERAGVNVICLAVGGDSLLHANNVDLPLRGTLQNMARLFNAVQQAAGAVTIIRSAAEIPTAPDGVFRYLLTLEGGRPLEGSVEMVDIYHALGLRSIQLVWNYRNELGDGAMEQGSGGGLSRFGRDVVRRAQQLGMVVDLAHATRETFWQTLAVAERPVIVSHANAYAVCPHPRNIEDEQIRAIAEQDGFIGIQRSPGRVHPEHPSLKGFVDHIEYMASLVGTRYIGIGLDFNQVSGPKSHKDERFASREPKHIEGFEHLENLRDVTCALLDRGLSTEEVAGIMGGNFLRVVASQIGG